MCRFDIDVPFFKEFFQVETRNVTTLFLRYYQDDYRDFESVSALLQLCLRVLRALLFVLFRSACLVSSPLWPW